MSDLVRREAFRWVAEVLERAVQEQRPLFERRAELLEQVRRIGHSMAVAGAVPVEGVHDDVGSLCTLPNCPHPHRPADAPSVTEVGAGKAIDTIARAEEAWRSTNEGGPF